MPASKWQNNTCIDGYGRNAKECGLSESVWYEEGIEKKTIGSTKCEVCKAGKGFKLELLNSPNCI